MNTYGRKTYRTRNTQQIDRYWKNKLKQAREQFQKNKPKKKKTPKFMRTILRDNWRMNQEFKKTIS